MFIISFITSIMLVEQMTTRWPHRAAAMLLQLVTGQWSSWQSWSDCDAGCGLGYTNRVRVCHMSSDNSTCAGDNREDRECQTHTDCIGKWERWQAWSPCAGGCVTGVKTRTRVCTKPDPLATPCIGDDIAKSLCFEHIDCPGEWLTWGDWGTCDAGCGQGQRHRLRLCDKPTSLVPCTGEREQTKNCVFHIDCTGVWQSWEAWSECDGGCGRGYTRRSRNCTKPHPLATCGSHARYQQRQCAMDIDCLGDWQTWSGWTTCNISCGRGYRKRERICVKTDPSSICTGQAEQQRTCTYRDCPVDLWGTWRQWSECSEGCGEGFKGRQRTCASHWRARPRCHGNGIEFIQCSMLTDCPAVWQTWGEWSQCNEGCGIGRKYRERGCDTLTPSVNCTGDWSDESLCSVQVDCAGMWSTWMEWGECDGGCGVGFKQRERECLKVAPNATCKGERRNSMACDVDLDCTVGWTKWSRWGECNDGCGEGFKFRNRVCRTSTGDCNGDNRQMKVCSMKRDCPPCPDRCEKCTRADDVIGCDVGYCQSGYERDRKSGECIGSSKLTDTKDSNVNQLYYLIVIPTLAIMILALGYWLTNKKGTNTVSVDHSHTESDHKLQTDIHDASMTASDAEMVAKFNEQEYQAYEMLVRRGRLSHPHERLAGIRQQLRSTQVHPLPSNRGR